MPVSPGTARSSSYLTNPNLTCPPGVAQAGHLPVGRRVSEPFSPGLSSAATSPSECAPEEVSNSGQPNCTGTTDCQSRVNPPQ